MTLIQNLPADVAEQKTGASVALIHDDQEVHSQIEAALGETTAVFKPFYSADEFLDAHALEGADCLLTAETVPGAAATPLLSHLENVMAEVPTIVIAAAPTTAVTVKAMKLGAESVLDYPCSDAALRAAVREAHKAGGLRREQSRRAAAAKEKLAGLSESEQRVLGMVLDGVPNKQIASRLNVCVRTVEARRSRIYQAAEVASVAALVRLCVAAGAIDS